MIQIYKHRNYEVKVFKKLDLQNIHKISTYVQKAYKNE